MDRATGFYPVGCGFDSCRGRHSRATRAPAVPCRSGQAPAGPATGYVLNASAAPSPCPQRTCCRSGKEACDYGSSCWTDRHAGRRMADPEQVVADGIAGNLALLGGRDASPDRGEGLRPTVAVPSGWSRKCDWTEARSPVVTPRHLAANSVGVMGRSVRQCGPGTRPRSRGKAGLADACHFLGVRPERPRPSRPRERHPRCRENNKASPDLGPKEVHSARVQVPPKRPSARASGRRSRRSVNQPIRTSPRSSKAGT